MDINKIFQSKASQGILFGLAGLIVVLFIFKVGMVVGSRKADFSSRWGEKYHQNFAGPRGGFFNDLGREDFIEANGVFGQVIKIDGQTLVVKGRDNVERIVLVKEDTAIMRFREKIKPSDLKNDDYVVVIGEPNDNGQIEAKLIRVLPPPPSGN